MGDGEHYHEVRLISARDEVFSLLMIQSSLLRTARVRIAMASEPAQDSVMAKQLTRSPSIVG
ncbi:hypothetical protein [Bradyrhizobium cytisi]|uniref:hypothetical protein n=1 Tax=Bradyrhizobium cytisi TaxID=515489 RepID=UPI001FEC9C14|nr:hypothetical protein [Bradyrhizobium cytisi]